MCMGKYSTTKTIQMSCFTSSMAIWKQQWYKEHSDIKPVRPGPEEHQILEQIGSVQSIRDKVDLLNCLNMRMSAHKQHLEFTHTLGPLYSHFI